jgi:hypothetical protein
MATSTNLGFQKLTFDFKSPLKGSDFNKLLYGITKPGVYKGLNLSKVGDTIISISSGLALLHTSFQGSTSSSTLVNFQTNISSYDVTRTNSSQNEIVYLKFDYLETTDNWVEVLHTNSGNLSSLSANAVILGEVIYNQSNIITSFNYDIRTYGLLNSDTSKVILNDSNIIGNVNNPTKQIKLSASNSASGTTRNISFPDYDYQVNSLNDWVTNRKYYVNEIITYDKIIYKCVTTHISSTFNSEVLIYWQRLIEKYEKEIFNMSSGSLGPVDITISSNTSLLLITGYGQGNTISTISPISGSFDDGKILEIQNETTSYLSLNIKTLLKNPDYAFSP